MCVECYIIRPEAPCAVLSCADLSAAPYHTAVKVSLGEGLDLLHVHSCPALPDSGSRAWQLPARIGNHRPADVSVAVAGLQAPSGRRLHTGLCA